jgi:hypothetical protein
MLMEWLASITSIAEQRLVCEQLITLLSGCPENKSYFLSRHQKGFVIWKL